ncbi:histidine kinase OS=Streptomyces glaucescens OX=1907 GN=SGLAU_19295 PE=4 SV=1 [Streptomyces glaucescens]
MRPARTDVQVLGPDGGIVDKGNPGLPVTDSDREIAAARTAGQLVVHKDVDVGDDVYRVATVALGGGRGAVQVAQEFSDTEDLLRALQQRTLVLMAAVVVGAGLFGWWLARRITRRLVILTDAAEAVRPHPAPRHRGARHRPRRGGAPRPRLRPDARQARPVRGGPAPPGPGRGHELRTPLTSLRTNISLLRRIDELPPDSRAELVADLGQEARELTDLVNELVDLAAGQSDNEPPQRVDLADLAEDVVGLARRRFGREITLRVSGDTAARVRPGMLTRAMSNLVDNAAKFDRAGTAPIELVLSGPAQGFPRPGPGHGARPRPRRRRHRPRAHLRPLLPRRRRPFPARLRARPVHRAGGVAGPRGHAVRAVPGRGRVGDRVHGRGRRR